MKLFYYFKRMLPVILLAALHGTAWAQSPPYALYLSNHPRFLKAGSSTDTLEAAFAGGLKSPQFSTIDLNGDFVKDLFVFDRMGGKVLTFINVGAPGTVNYVYKPEYEHLFPSMKNWALLVDYNGDGKEDIFTNSNAAATSANFEVHRNTTPNTSPYIPNFTLLTSTLRTRPDSFWAEDPNTGDSVLYTTSNPVSSFNRNLPLITDVDNDGDIDIMSFPAAGNVLNYYMNFSKELGHNKDSLLTRVVDQCWGYFGEGLGNDTVYLNVPICKFYPKQYKKKHEEGSTLMMFDNDGDGDKELFLSNRPFGKFHMLINGKKDYNSRYDSITSYISGYPTNKPGNIPDFVAGYYLDIDQDGKRDLIVSVNDMDSGSALHQVWLYRNIGSDLIPSFEFKTDSFLQDMMVDLGGRTAPLFWDFDQDGDQDLFIAYAGDTYITRGRNDRIALYENVHNASNPVFRLKTRDFFNLDGRGLEAIAPTMGDLNGDGKPDLLLGTKDGSLRLFTNASVGNTFLFNYTDTAYQQIKLGQYTTPQLVDLDRDGKLDLVMGERNGNVNYLRNTGTAANPVFTLVTDTLGRVKANEFITNIATPDYSPTGYSAPFITDLDTNGSYDLILGCENGMVRLFPNIEGNLQGTFTEEPEYANLLGTNDFGIPDVGFTALTALTDLTGDGRPDMIIGNPRGGITLYASDKNISGALGVKPVPSQVNVLKAYPNPANTQLILETIQNAGKLRIQMVDALGREVMLVDSLSGMDKTALDISSLNNGIYFLQVSNADRFLQSIKVLVLH